MIDTKLLFLKGLEFLTYSRHSVNVVYYYHSLWGHEQKGLVTANSVVNTLFLWVEHGQGHLQVERSMKYFASH